MNHQEFNDFCRSLPATSHVVQWGGSHVWKVGDKVFAIGSGTDSAPAYSFKTNDISFELLQEQSGLRPAPYLASRGMKWIRHYAEPGLADDDLRHYLRQSHQIVGRGLSKKKQRALGLDWPE